MIRARRIELKGKINNGKRTNWCKVGIFESNAERLGYEKRREWRVVGERIRVWVENNEQKSESGRGNQVTERMRDEKSTEELKIADTSLVFHLSECSVAHHRLDANKNILPP